MLGPGGRKASVSGFLLGAAGPRAGGSVSAASPGYFIKEEEKKIKSPAGETRIFCKFFLGFFKGFFRFFCPDSLLFSAEWGMGSGSHRLGPA